MTKKDYLAFAEIFRNALNLPDVILGMANHLEEDNSDFNREGFVRACGFTETGGAIVRTGSRFDTEN